MANILEVNKKIDVEVKEGVYKGTFKSRIQGVGDKEISITVPIKKGDYIPLRVGTKVSLLVYDESAICVYSCKIIARKKGNIPILILELPAKYKRIQRRNFYRLKINLPLLYRPAPFDKDDEGEEYRKGDLVDISGGGLQMKFLRDQEIYPLSTRLEFKIQFPDIGELFLKGIIVSRFKKKESIHIGVKFFDITTKVQDEIVGWIFKKMRTLRKKGLL